MSAPERPAVSRRLEAKVGRLRLILRDMGRVLVAFSGGTDSAFLLKVAADVLGSGVLAVTAASPVHRAGEGADARKLARCLKVRHEVVRFPVLDNPRFVENSARRCYYCKKDLWRMFRTIAGREGATVVDGQNLDDERDFRPGAAASREMGVRSPLREAGLRKAEIRAYSRKLGLPTWDKPPQACLASRIPYGVPVREKTLARVAGAEEDLRRLGFGQLRVRDLGTVARLELDPAGLARVLDEKIRRRVVARLRRRGYLHVAVDLSGYRTGSLNEGLVDRPGRQKKRPGRRNAARVR